MKKIFLFGIGVITLLAMPFISMAREYPIGGPIQTHDMEISANYLLGVTMSPATKDMAKGPDTIHLETDVHATADNVWGFPDGAWIPYMTVKYTLSKEKSPWKNQGILHPMTAKDGPHYANNIKMNGPGRYTVIFYYGNPQDNDFAHHTDPETGTPSFLKTFSQSFVFNYPSAP